MERAFDAARAIAATYVICSWTVLREPAAVVIIEGDGAIAGAVVSIGDANIADSIRGF